MEQILTQLTSLDGLYRRPGRKYRRIANGTSSPVAMFLWYGIKYYHYGRNGEAGFEHVRTELLNIGATIVADSADFRRGQWDGALDLYARQMIHNLRASEEFAEGKT